MTRSGQGQPHNANVTSGEGDILQEAIVREEEAAALDRDLKVKVRAKQGAIAKDLRSAAQRALDGDRVARERKATRDRMLRETIAHRFLLLTDQVKAGDLDRALRTLTSIETDYVAQTRLRVECSRFLHIPLVVVPLVLEVDLEDVDAETLKLLRLLVDCIGDLRQMRERQVSSAMRLWRRVDDQVSVKTDPLRQPLRDGEMTPEDYAGQLAGAIETVLDELLSEEKVERASRKRRVAELIAVNVGLGLVTNAIWDEAKGILQSQPFDGMFQGAREKTEATSAGSPMFCGNAARTGVQPGPGPNGTPSERWRFQCGDRGWFTSSPAVIDGMVYVGGNAGHVYALDAAGGHELWRFQAGSGVPTSPAVVGGVVYVGSYDHNVYALDAAGGHELWRFQTGGGVTSSPAVVGGVVYVGSDDGHLYALDAAGGREHWRVQIGGGVRSSPAVAEGLVYVGNSDSHVYALDAADGREHWRVQTGVWAEASPAVAKGLVYIGSSDGNLYALDAADGRMRWRYQAKGWITSSPAIAAGVVYVGGSDRHVYALDAAHGRKRWRFQTYDVVASSPSVVDGVVYVGSTDGYVYALDAARGHARWGWRSTRGYEVDTSPVVVDGMVYVGSDDGYVYAIGD